MCASPVVLLLSFVFLCCGSLTVRFRVSVKYFATPPTQELPPPMRIECISISGLSICKSCKRKKETKRGQKGRQEVKKSCKCREIIWGNLICALSEFPFSLQGQGATEILINDIVRV